MAGRIVPNDHDRKRAVAKPSFESVQELDRLFAIAGAFVPQQALSSQEVIGAIPVNAIGQTWAITRPPSGLAYGRPGVTQVEVAMKVCFVDVNDSDLCAAELLKLLVKGLNVRLTLSWIGFFE